MSTPSTLPLRVAAGLLLFAIVTPLGAALNRPSDPVVMTGNNVPSLQGVAPDRIVAFRWSNGWQQIRVQVDERDMKDLALVMNRAADPRVVHLEYVDPNTFTGADSDPMLDTDDEIVFMAKDAGARPPAFSEPIGVIAGTGVEVRVTDALDTSGLGYVYLFQHNGTLNPGAGLTPYASYLFALNSGDYKTTYKTSNGPNPENSTITTARYSQHFKDRWVNDIIRITTPGATGVDILDQRKFQFGPSTCTRTVETFSSGPGAFIVNKQGPVRCIRGYVGANSGDYTQRVHLYYESLEMEVTDLRVHPIAAAGGFMDHAPAAQGMRWYNTLNITGKTIDGVADTYNDAPANWTMVSGTQGTYVISHQIYSNFAGLTLSYYYLDATKPRDRQCTGDAFAYGNSGPWVTSGVPCTDDRSNICAPDSTHYFTWVNAIYFEPPNQTVTIAGTRDAQARTPLSFFCTLWKP